jgi:hypothetical protein
MRVLGGERSLAGKQPPLVWPDLGPMTWWPAAVQSGGGLAADGPGVIPTNKILCLGWAVTRTRWPGRSNRWTTRSGAPKQPAWCCAGGGGWPASTLPENVSETDDGFSAAASLALCDVRVDRLGPVHDGRCGQVQAVFDEPEYALDQAERFRRSLPGTVEDAESCDGQVLGSEVRNRRWRGIWFASCSTGGSPADKAVETTMPSPTRLALAVAVPGGSAETSE